MPTEPSAGLTELTADELSRTAGGLSEPVSPGMIDAVIRYIIGSGGYGTDTGGGPTID